MDFAWSYINSAGMMPQFQPQVQHNQALNMMNNSVGIENYTHGMPIAGSSYSKYGHTLHDTPQDNLKDTSKDTSKDNPQDNPEDNQPVNLQGNPQDQQHDVPFQQCPVCGQIYLTELSMKRHMKDAHGEKHFICDVCGKQYGEQKLLEKHLRKHSQSKLPCPFCGVKFTSRSTLKHHVLSHSKIRNFQCRLCDKRFKHKSTLSMHMKDHESQAQGGPRECNVCRKTFATPRRLTLHMNLHYRKRQFQCSVCGRSFISQSILKVHMKVHKNPVVISHCPQCGKTFDSQRNLETHMKSHQGKKTHECPVCRKEYAHSWGLKDHMFSHSDHNPFKCPICGKQLKNDSSLRYHKLTHEKKKPINCESCGKGFNRQAEYDKHLKRCNESENITHTDLAALRVYEENNVEDNDHEGKELCPHCGKWLKRSSMYTHIRSHNNKSVQRCPLCNEEYASRREHKQKCSMEVEEGDADTSVDKSAKKTSSNDDHCVDGDSSDKDSEKMSDRKKQQSTKNTGQTSRVNSASVESDDEENSIDFPKIDVVKVEADDVDRDEDKRESSDEEKSGQNHGKNDRRNSDNLRSDGRNKKKSPSDQSDKQDKLSHKCPLCEQAFDKAGDLISHVKCHGVEKDDGTISFECPQCSKVCYSGRNMITHMLSHSGRTIFDCSECDKEYLKAAALKEHILSAHSGGKPYKCEICGKQLSNDSSMRYHRKMHEKRMDKKAGKKYACSICNEQFGNKVVYNKHVKRHRAERLSECECHICGKRFKNKLGLSSHKRTHETKKRLECDMCGQGFPDEMTLTNHQCTDGASEMHEHTNDYFDDDDNDDDEVKSATAATSDGFPSPNPDDIVTMATTTAFDKDLMSPNQSLMTPTRLRNKTVKHPGHHGAGARGYEESDEDQPADHRIAKRLAKIWDGLDQGFDIGSQQDASVGDASWQRNFSGVQLPSQEDSAYECSHCGKTFQSSRSFVTHMKKHWGGRTFDCKICHKEYAHQSGLRDHMYTHQDKPSFVCKICGSGVKTESKLRYHMKKHGKLSGFKVAECRVGSSSFNEASGSDTQTDSQFGILAKKTEMVDESGLEGLESEQKQSIDQCAKTGSEMNVPDLSNTPDQQDTSVGMTSSLEETLSSSNAKPLDDPSANAAIDALEIDPPPIASKLNDEANANVAGARSESDLSSVHDEAEDYALDRPHECLLCKLRFKDMTALQSHLSTHEGEAYQCKQCPKVFASRRNFVTHMKKHSGKRTFECEICHKDYAHPSGLRDHMYSHQDKPSFVCKICGVEIKNESKMRYHMKKHGKSGFTVAESRVGSSLRKASKKGSETRKVSRSGRLTKKARMADESDLVGTEIEQPGNASSKTNNKLDVSDLSNISEQREGTVEQSDASCSNEWHKDALEINRPSAPKHYDEQSANESCGGNESESSSVHAEDEDEDLDKPHECLLCNMRFEDMTALQSHLLTHKGESYKCKKCPKVFSSRRNFLTHMKKHSGKRTFECQICHKEYAHASGLREHMFMHQDTPAFICNICGIELKSESKWRYHMRTHEQESTQKRFKCTECDMAYKYKVGLQKHFAQMHDRFKSHEIDPWKTPTPQQHVEAPNSFSAFSTIYSAYSTAAAVGLELATEASSDPANVTNAKLFSCKECHKIFVTHRGMLRHVTQEHIEKPHECLVCSKRFVDESQLKVHLKLHIENNNHLCAECGAVCKSAAALKRHLLQHGDDRPYQCDQCEKSFKYRDALKHHAMKHNATRVECTVCGKAFVNPEALVRHMRQGHDDSRPFTCPICNKGFKDKGSLRGHQKTHLGPECTALPCVVCGKVFETQLNLKTHMKSHQGKKTHECPVCRKEYAHSWGLKDHMFSHSDHNPFKCPICGKQLKNDSSLRYHRLTHDKIKKFNCPICGKGFNRKQILSNHKCTGSFMNFN